MSVPIILDNKEPDAPSVFEPAALLREARRQKRNDYLLPMFRRSASSIPMAILSVASEIPDRRSCLTSGPATIPTFMNSRSLANLPASLGVSSERRLRFWLPKNCSHVVVAC
jgi:hypothetical protein